jgi:hypothetical protein
MHWQEFAALAIVGVAAALFVKGFLRRSPSSCGRGCACPSAGAKSRPGGASGGDYHKDVIDTSRT